jgi:mono/diheme cytochrome c family protein
VRLALAVPVLLAVLLAAAPDHAQAAVGLVTDDGRRTPITVPGEPGLLTSDSTRIDGLVTPEDVASGRLRVVPDDDPAEALRTLDRRIERNERWHLPLTLGLAALLIGLALVRPQLAVRALLVVLAANLWLSPVLALVAAVAVLVLPLGLACAAILAAYLVAMGLDAETVALSPFGPSQTGRYYGINNLLETMLLAPAIVGAALLGPAGVGVAALAFVTIGGNRFGADGGGLVVLAAAYLVLVLRLQGRRASWRLAAAVAAGAVALALLVLGIDAATGGSSHVTGSVGGGPGEVLGDVGDRIERSVRSSASFGGIAIVLGSLAILVGVALRARRTPVLEAFLAAIAVSLLVNDTPGDVLGIGAAIAVALARAPVDAGSIKSRSMRRAALLLTLLALAIGLAGCGGGEEAAPLPETVEGTVPQATTTSETPASTIEGDPAKGEAVWASAGCGGCHTMAAANASGSIGPNLDDTKPDLALVVDRVTNGRGAMPAFKDDLTEQQIADVAAYVVSSTSG